jgi:hypothetical protein
MKRLTHAFVPRRFSETATEITRRFPPHVFQSRQDITLTFCLVESTDLDRWMPYAERRSSRLC